MIVWRDEKSQLLAGKLSSFKDPISMATTIRERILSIVLVHQRMPAIVENQTAAKQRNRGGEACLRHQIYSLGSNHFNHD